MKTSADPRHLRRIKQVQFLFSASFNHQPDESIIHIWNQLPVIDPKIQQIAPEWPLDKLNRIDLAILRLAVYEMLVDRSEPAKVIIDEAIEIAKSFGGDSSPSFINGALGQLL